LKVGVPAVLKTILSLNQASQAWMEWVMKKRKAFDQRGDMAVAAWAEQQQREMTLRARRLSRSKVILQHYTDPPSNQISCYPDALYFDLNLHLKILNTG
jgi:hypothetical protein